jgi:hypothetical protein
MNYYFTCLRFVGLLFFAVGLSAFASAQSIPAVPLFPSQAPAGLRAPADTVRALHRLFAARRAGGHIWAVVALGGSLTSLWGATIGLETKIAGGPRTYQKSFSGPTQALVLGGAVAVPVVLSLSRLVRFSKENERDVIEKYTTTGRLPASVAARLREKHFRP